MSEPVGGAVEDYPDMVSIPLAEYESLLDDNAWRVAYENAGVDNWGGVDFANELYREYSAGI